ncbi:universal stress protein [Vagococcus acidifermentans]|uniref:Universal stress protein n=1 Tax=Vagococcus acidifermentans TaxID=564710 RepID=A0A430B395_9ENTE|nr:universal stress protein [Vagococcus acidifermentans]RSU14784.1 universal stress protein UspA [Vagococcus acidifermentans]
MSELYQHILVAVDGSDSADAAFEEAVAIAKKYHAMLYVLYVNEVTSRFLGDFNIITDKMQRALEEVAENKVNQCLQRAVELGLTDIKTFIKHGSPKTWIVDFDESKGPIDLIVMGATGVSGIERVLAGSTTTYVVNHADCSVLVVR